MVCVIYVMEAQTELTEVNINLWFHIGPELLVLLVSSQILKPTASCVLHL